MRKILVLGLIVLFVGSVAVAADNSSSSNLPKYILLNREEIKFGRMGDHDALMHQMIQTINTTNADFHFVSATSVTGSQSDFIGIGTFNSYADIEKGMDTLRQSAKANMQNADFIRESQESHVGSRVTIAKLQADLSHNTDKLNLGSGRYWDVTMIEVKPGAEDDFEQLAKEYVELHDKGKIDVGWAVYQVQYGGTGATYIYITPLHSLADLDVDRAAAYKAVFTPGVSSRFNAAFRQQVSEVKSMLLAMRPDISRPEQSMVAANPEFWTVKEAVATAPAATKTKGKKKAPVEPAALKQNDQPK
jgi:hypothetical protein